MPGARFLFVTWSGGGNTIQIYHLIRPLVARGHRVTVLGQSAQADEIRALGARFVPLVVPDWTPGKSLEDEFDTLFGILLDPPVGKAVLESAGREAPDAIVVDCMLSSALAAAELSGIPSAAVVHVLYHQFVRGTMGAMWIPRLHAINATRAGFGLPAVGSPAALLDPMRVVLVTSPREFDVSTSDLPPNIRHVGAILDDPPPAGEGSTWREGGARPRVLVAFSTTCQHQEDLLRRISAALAALPVEAVITTGPAVDPAAIDPAPNVAVHGYLPHRALLPGCAAVVTHAGLGSVMTALAHGVPLVCIPMGRDQHDNAARAAALGAGVVLAADCGAREIRHAIEALLGDPRYGAAARRFAPVIARQDGRAAALGELEALAGATGPAA